MRKWLSLVLAGFLVMLAVAGCAGQKKEEAPTSQPQQEKVVRFNNNTEPKTADPGVSEGIPEANVEYQLFEGLMRLDEKDQPVPGMAEKYDVKDNGLTYVFYLRDAKWSNGDPVTANDFVYAWQRALDPRTASPYAYQLYYIKGGKALNEVPVKTQDGQDRPDADIARDVEAAKANLGVKAIDPKTLEVRLEAPTPYFLHIAAFNTLFPLNKKAVESGEGWFRDPNKIITNGPFLLKEWTPKEKIVMVKNPDYWAADQVKIDRLEFYPIEDESTAMTMYESGQLDVVDNPPISELDRIKRDMPDQLKIRPQLATYYYLFNTTRGPLKDKRVRQALNLAIDRKAIVTQITKGGQVPALAFVPPGIQDVQGDFRNSGGDFYKDNDVEKARQLLAEAGYPGGKGFPKLTLLYNTSKSHKAVAEAIQEMWKKNLGIEVQLQNQEWQVFLDTLHQLNYDIARGGWSGDYVDPMTFLDLFVSGGGNNYTGFNNTRYDQLVEKAKRSSDQVERMQAMHDAEKLLMDEMPVMPIYYYTELNLEKPKLKGLHVSMLGYHDFRGVYWEQ